MYPRYGQQLSEKGSGLLLTGPKFCFRDKRKCCLSFGNQCSKVCMRSEESKLSEVQRDVYRVFDDLGIHITSRWQVTFSQSHTLTAWKTCINDGNNSCQRSRDQVLGAYNVQHRNVHFHFPSIYLGFSYFGKTINVHNSNRNKHPECISLCNRFMQYMIFTFWAQLKETVFYHIFRTWDAAEVKDLQMLWTAKRKRKGQHRWQVASELHLYPTYCSNTSPGRMFANILFIWVCGGKIL